MNQIPAQLVGEPIRQRGREKEEILFREATEILNVKFEIWNLYHIPHSAFQNFQPPLSPCFYTVLFSNQWQVYILSCCKLQTLNPELIILYSIWKISLLPVPFCSSYYLLWHPLQSHVSHSASRTSLLFLLDEH